MRKAYLVARTGVLAGILAGAFVLVLVLFLCDPERMPIYPICLFHKLTGLDCPGCGSLRALHALLHGQWMAALRFNLLLVLSLPLFAWFGLRFAWSEVRGGPGVVIRPVWIWLYAAAWIAFGILRNLPFPVCAGFCP